MIGSDYVPYNYARTNFTTLSNEEIERGIDSISNGLLDHLSPAGFNAIIWTCVGICTCFVAGRFWIRLTKTGRLAIDDWLIFAAYVFLVLNCILQTCQMPDIVNLIVNSKRIAYLMGINAKFSLAGEYEYFVRGNRFLKYEFTIIGFFWTVLWLVKASFLAFFYTLFEGLPKYRKVWWAVVVFTFLAYVGCWVASANNCSPPKNYFILGKCGTPEDAQKTIITIIYSAVVDILIDVIIMAMPLRLLYNVQISFRQKLALSAVFSMGIIIIIFAIIRAVQVTTTARDDTFLLAFWGLLESTVAVIVGCLPPFKSLFSNVGSTKPSREYYGETNGLGQYGAGSRMRGGGSVPLQSHASIRGGKNSWRDDEEYIMNSSRESLTKQREVDDWAEGRIMVKKDINITTGVRPVEPMVSGTRLDDIRPFGKDRR